MTKGESTAGPKWPPCLGRSHQRESDGWKKSWASRILVKSLAWRKEKKHQLCNRLLQLWAQGRLSATQVAEIAHLTLLERCQSKEILQLAECGTLGEKEKQFSKGSGCTRLQVPKQDCKWQKETTADAAILLPHFLFSKLSENYVGSFENFFCVPECQAFWKGVQKGSRPHGCGTTCKKWGCPIT